VVREEIRFARSDPTEVKETQQDIILLLHGLLLAGQERARSLNSRAKREKTRTQVWLDNLSDKHEVWFAFFQLDAAIANSDDSNDTGFAPICEDTQTIIQDSLPTAVANLQAAVAAN
jgi:hypothetical protein